MVKLLARHKTTNKPAMIFGLSEMNIERLKKGEPISFTGESMGVPEVDKITLFYGVTEKAMFEDLKKNGMKAESEFISMKSMKP